jgi:hypothetical protein
MCNQDKKRAEGMLAEAQAYYENGQPEAARKMLDSMKIAHPKQPEVLLEGLQLMRLVELQEQERNLAFCDSMLIVRTAEMEAMKPLFVYEKDPEYDDVGRYLDQQQVLERNLKRSYLRSGVNEHGEMYLASVYYGSGRIHHYQLKVTAPDNTYAETAVIPEDGSANFAFEDLGMTTEVVTYQSGKDNGVISFIYNHKDQGLNVELITNKKNYRFAMNEGDRKSLIKTFDFAAVLSDLDRLNKERQKAENRITYLQSKVAQ